MITLLPLISLSACTWQEDLTHLDFEGTVRIPVEAVKYTHINDDGNVTVIEDDPRFIGPVYLGAYSGVTDLDFGFPHPSMGPVVESNQPGDTYPYGGGSIGRFAFACYERLVCKTVSGRYNDYAEVLDLFNNVLAPLESEDLDKDGDIDIDDTLIQPNELNVVDRNGDVVNNEDAFREHCYELLDFTSDEEVDFVPPYGLDTDLDFVRDGDFYVAEVELLDIRYVEGMKIWGWVDMPANGYNFATCDNSLGQNIVDYTEDFWTGSGAFDLLNNPSLYLDDGDYLVDEAPSVDKPSSDDGYAPFEVTLGFPYEG